VAQKVDCSVVVVFVVVVGVVVVEVVVVIYVVVDDYAQERDQIAECREV